MSYTIQYDNSEYSKTDNKDEVILALMGLLNGDGVMQIRITYPDGSYYEMVGEGGER